MMTRPCTALSRRLPAIGGRARPVPGHRVQTSLSGTRRAVTLALGLLLSGAAADPFGVSPTLIELAGNQRTATVRITNPSAQPVKYEVSASAWSEQTGEDVYQSTADVVLTPPVFLLRPGGSQIVRVGLKVPVPANSPERAYRVFVSQLATPQSGQAQNALAQTPPPAAGAPASDQVNANVRVLFRIALPMFVLPASPAPKASWTVTRAGGQTAVTLTNTGNSYVRYGGLKVMQGSKLIGAKAVMYALAGQHHTLTLNMPVESGKVTITYEVNQEPHSETIVVQ